MSTKGEFPIRDKIQIDQENVSGKTSYFRNLICGFFYMVKNERKVAGKPFLDFLMMFNNKYTLNIDNLRPLKDISSDND